MDNHPAPLELETLERLLTDQAMGALAPDVESLLTSYVAFDRRGQTALREITRTIETARSVLDRTGVESGASLPPLRAASGRRGAWPRRIAAAAALAACLLAGFALRTWTESPASPLPAHLNTGQPGGQVSETTQTDARTGGSDFWSIRRLYESARNAPDRRPSGVNWTTPLGKPQLKGQT